MNNLAGLDLKTIVFLVLAILIVVGIVKKLFKLAIFVGIVAVLFYLYNALM